LKKAKKRRVLRKEKTMSKCVRNEYIQFNAEIFRKDITERKISMQSMSYFLGRGMTYVGDATRAGVINKSVLKLLCKEYNLDINRYIIKENVSTDNTETLDVLKNIESSINRLASLITAMNNNLVSLATKGENK
jgi:hypothetical protein